VFLEWETAIENRMQNQENPQPPIWLCDNERRNANNNLPHPVVEKEENFQNCRISSEISFTKHVRNVIAGWWNNLSLGRTQSKNVKKERFTKQSKLADHKVAKGEIGYTALSVPNLESIDDLVADGAVVVSEAFNEQNEEEKIIERRHNETSIEEPDVEFDATESLILQLKAEHSVMSMWDSGLRGDTVLRYNPGRRSDLGSVGTRCLSWSGPESENETRVGQSLAHLVGRKGGMV